MLPPAHVQSTLALALGNTKRLLRLLSWHGWLFDISLAFSRKRCARFRPREARCAACSEPQNRPAKRTAPAPRVSEPVNDLSQLVKLLNPKSRRLNPSGRSPEIRGVNGVLSSEIRGRQKRPLFGSKSPHEQQDDRWVHQNRLRTRHVLNDGLYCMRPLSHESPTCLEDLGTSPQPRHPSQPKNS